MSICLLPQISKSKGLLFQFALVETASLGDKCQKLVDSLQKKPLPPLPKIISSLEEIIGNKEKWLGPLFEKNSEDEGFSHLTSLFKRLEMQSNDKRRFRHLSEAGDKATRLLLELILALRFSKQLLPKKIYDEMAKIAKLFSTIIHELWHLFPEFSRDERVLWHILKHREQLIPLFGNKLLRFLEQSHPRGLKNFLISRFKKRGFNHIALEIESEALPS
jgi:hypothetical protein